MEEIFPAENLHLIKLPDENKIRVGLYNKNTNLVYVFSKTKNYYADDVSSIMLTPDRPLTSLSERYAFQCYRSDCLFNIFTNGGIEANVFYNNIKHYHKSSFTKEEILELEKCFQKNIKNINKLIYREHNNENNRILN